MADELKCIDLRVSFLCSRNSAKFDGIEWCDGTVRDTIRVETNFIIQAELPIADRYIHYKLKWDVYPHPG